MALGRGKCEFQENQKQNERQSPEKPEEVDVGQEHDF